MSTLIMWHNRFSENGNEAVEAHIPHDIEIPRHFFRGQKHQDSKTEKPRHRNSKIKKPQYRVPVEF